MCVCAAGHPPCCLRTSRSVTCQPLAPARAAGPGRPDSALPLGQARGMSGMSSWWRKPRSHDRSGLPECRGQPLPAAGAIQRARRCPPRVQARPARTCCARSRAKSAAREPASTRSRSLGAARAQGHARRAPTRAGTTRRACARASRTRPPTHAMPGCSAPPAGSAGVPEWREPRLGAGWSGDRGSESPGKCAACQWSAARGACIARVCHAAYACWRAGAA